jgi:hypothetical protein
MKTVVGSVFNRGHDCYNGSRLRDLFPIQTRELSDMNSYRSRFAVVVFAAGVLFVSSPAAGVGAEPRAAPEEKARIDYSRDIRPILSNNCFKCHGPDAAERQAELRLDVREAALKPAESGLAAIVAGEADASELIRRVFSTDADELMPPPDSKKKLTAAEKQLLKQWIAQGAEYQKLWSFVSPQRPALPAVKNATWLRNEIDRFILARLEAEGLRPSAEADKTTLIRRVTLDLTGLPPTLAEIDAFLADDSDKAYDRVVDRLLASPHYGERLALEWLDAARYADTHGFHIDSGRDMTRWREWVIDAFNHNLPFDRFTIEQLAGDLLPSATLDQKVASGFNRNHMINFEGGAIPQEYHNAYIVDRVNTTGTVWLGLTIGCAQCHDHKYDPLTQKEYYQLYAFFHNVPESGLDGSKGNAMPFLKSPTGEQQRKMDALRAEQTRLEEHLKQPSPQLDAALAEWEKTALAEAAVPWTVLDASQFASKGGATLEKLEDKSLVAGGANPATETYTIVAASDLQRITAVRLEALPDDRFIAKGPGRSVNGNIVLTDVRIAASAQDGAGEALKLKAASADFSQKDFPVALAIDDKPNTGWAIHPEVGQPHQAVFELAQPLETDGGTQLTVTLDFQSKFTQHQLGRFRLSVTGASSPHQPQQLPANIQSILAIAPGERSHKQKAELREYYAAHVSPAARQTREQLETVKQSLAEIERQIPTTMVMQEMPQPRDTFVLVRGQYDKQGQQVAAAVPASLPPLPPAASKDRLALARWLVDPSQPLTSRVIVNRYWQMLLGTGLVKTTEDFGSQGELPSHPELLDWLAVEFMSPAEQRAPVSAGDQVSDGWNVKALIKQIVMSATYRQSSVVTPELYERDPENRLLARGPRHRLPAEFIRDQALAVSGLLNKRIGGASVFPYQPKGLWEELMSRADGAKWTAQVYTPSHGEDLYRRTMYTFWKRTSPPPTLSTFDAPDRETCTVRRAITNTPLQALVLMNDPTYVEASRKLAERIMTQAGPSPDERITFAFRLATARRPTANELAVLRRIFDEQLAVYRSDTQQALKLLSAGESPRNETLDASELAAWAMVASVILNLDETVTRS